MIWAINVVPWHPPAYVDKPCKSDALLLTHPLHPLPPYSFCLSRLFSPLPVIPLILVLLRRCRRPSPGRRCLVALAHGGRPDGAVLRLPLVRQRREVVPECLLGLIKRRRVATPGCTSCPTGPRLGALNELVEALLRAPDALLCGLGEAAAKRLGLGCEVRFTDLLLLLPMLATKFVL